MKIYTRNGDNGTAGLFSGERVLKCHDQINAFGDVDELNSALGVLLALIPEDNEYLIAEILEIQSDLLHIGAWLATARNSTSLSSLKEISDKRVNAMEQAIDRMDATIDPIKRFILPNGNLAAAWSHMVRTICRRAERNVVRLSMEASLGKPPKHLRGVLIYLNRLSDYLFVLARYCNQNMKLPDRLWKN